ncbi:MAG TPA: response regulator, partial [Verrucomicrobiae bacterium]|nr:response regulator [Verrucomicrobiae bacterium]
IVAVPTISAAADWLRSDRADCLVLGTRPEESELEALGDVRNGGEIPLIVYGPPELSEIVEGMLKSGGRGLTAIPVTSPERLLDECALRLHRPVGRMSDRQRQVLEEMHYGSRALAGRRVLIVDDDIRNIFALTSILERHDMSIVSAETGRAAVDILDACHDVEVVLMDVMMPEMDGFETTRTIRADGRFKSLPIIAVTAKAMKGDREKCIEAGASDYLAKPVDPEELVAKLRAWLLR